MKGEIFWPVAALLSFSILGVRPLFLSPEACPGHSPETGPKDLFRLPTS
jgi:hypothetical protein